MPRVVIGVDSHKVSNTVVVTDAHERVPAQQRFANDRAGLPTSSFWATSVSSSGSTPGLKELKKSLAEVLAEHPSTPLEINGVGPINAAKILAEAGDVRRFPSRHYFAGYTGTAPIDVSSGENNRHRLNRGGNRRLHHALHIAAAVQYRMPGPGQDYYRRKRDQGKTDLEALRCLKRRLSDVVYRRLVDDLAAGSLGGHVGASLRSSAADLIPIASTSEQSLPGRASPSRRFSTATFTSFLPTQETAGPSKPSPRNARGRSSAVTRRRSRTPSSRRTDWSLPLMPR